MTDHLAKARDAYAVAVATGWPEDALTEVVAHVLDQLEAEQSSPEPDRDPECVKRWPECEPSAYNPAPKPAEPPTTAPQPAQAHGDADEPTKPKLNVQTESWTAIAINASAEEEA